MPNEGREKFFIFNTAAISGKRKKRFFEKSQIFWKMRENFSDLKVACGRSLLSENSGSVGMPSTRVVVCSRKRSKISNIRGVSAGPTCRQSFKEVPNFFIFTRDTTYNFHLFCLCFLSEYCHMRKVMCLISRLHF